MFVHQAFNKQFADAEEEMVKAEFLTTAGTMLKQERPAEKPDSSVSKMELNVGIRNDSRSKMKLSWQSVCAKTLDRGKNENILLGFFLMSERIIAAENQLFSRLDSGLWLFLD